MLLNAFRFLSVIFTAIAMAGAFAHLFELPNKINLGPDDYLIVQQTYRGWALLGIPAVGAVVSTLAIALMERRRDRVFWLTLTASLFIALPLVVFFFFTYPANQQTLNWTVLPDNWEALRRQWEYSHAGSAGLYFLGFLTLVVSLLARRDAR
jgi:hypothetical protein